MATLVRRVERVRDVLGRLSSPPATERDVARCVAGEQELLLPGSPSTEPPSGLFVANLRDAAILEADRARVTRALGATADVPIATRTFIAAASRHLQWSGYSAYRLEFTEPDDELIWETVVGVAYQACVRELRSSATLREHARAAQAALGPVIRDEQQVLLARLGAALQAPVALAISREQAIIGGAERRHARLAAALVQGGLFDRHAERQAAADSASLDELLSRCLARLARLAGRRHPIAGARDAVFALISR